MLRDKLRCREVARRFEIDHERICDWGRIYLIEGLEGPVPNTAAVKYDYPVAEQPTQTDAFQHIFVILPINTRDFCVS